MGEMIVSVELETPRTAALPTGDCATNPRFVAHGERRDGHCAVMLVPPENVVAG